MARFRGGFVVVWRFRRHSAGSRRSADIFWNMYRMKRSSFPKGCRRIFRQRCPEVQLYGSQKANFSLEGSATRELCQGEGKHIDLAKCVLSQNQFGQMSSFFISSLPQILAAGVRVYAFELSYWLKFQKLHDELLVSNMFLDRIAGKSFLTALEFGWQSHPKVSVNLCQSNNHEIDKSQKNVIRHRPSCGCCISWIHLLLLSLDAVRGKTCSCGENFDYFGQTPNTVFGGTGSPISFIGIFKEILSCRSSAST